MKNLLYIVIGAGFLGIISSSASGFLTTETSDTLDNLYEENFYIDPELIEVSDDKVKILLNQVNANNAERKINDCLNFYKSEYENKTIECNILINKNIAVEEDCLLISGEFTKKEEKEIITIIKDTSC
tara:strand:+ start:152 stop:535 length:384 start_codon:yes stop_codon:yes gene_type:complete